MNVLDRPQPPRLPDPPASGVSTGFFASFSNALRIYLTRVANVLNVLTGQRGGVYLDAPYAMLMSTVDQPSAGITSANFVTYNQTVLGNGIEVRNNHEIWFSDAGQFLVTLRLNFANRGNAVQTIDVWAREDGNDYPLSGTRVDIPARKSTDVWSHAAVVKTGIFTVNNPDTNFLSIAWWSDGANVFLEHYDAGTSPTRPAIPSAIVTINSVSRLPATP